MAQYIDKSALVAEINRRIEKLLPMVGFATTIKGMNMELAREELKNLRSFLNTLEVKDVDLEKETDKYISENFYGSETLGFFANRTKEEPNWKDIALCAKHFFELGIKAQKGE